MEWLLVLVVVVFVCIIIGMGEIIRREFNTMEDAILKRFESSEKNFRELSQSVEDLSDRVNQTTAHIEHITKQPVIKQRTFLKTPWRP